MTPDLKPESVYGIGAVRQPELPEGQINPGREMRPLVLVLVLVLARGLHAGGKSAEEVRVRDRAAVLPALNPMKPGSCGPMALGIYAVIFDEDGNVVEAGSGKAGNICIRAPWPGVFETIWGQPERFVDTYFKKYNKDPDSKDWHDWPYFAGDGAVQAADGYFRILGRVDDVINVAGHRLGTKELESSALSVDEVAEAAAVPVVDDVRGRAVAPG